MHRLRIFLTTSHISSVFMTLHARATHAEGDMDVLLVDRGARRRSVTEAIRCASALHDWSLFHSFSTEVDDDHRFEPSLRKRLTRRWKELPLLRSIYSVLLRGYEARAQRADLAALKGLLAGTIGPGASVELFVHTQNHLQPALLRLFPGANLSFFEHGLGDYHYIIEHGLQRGPMIALFGGRFAEYLQKRGIDPREVRHIELPADVPALMTRMLDALRLPHLSIPDERPVAWVLLEAVDMYEVPQAFWGAYIDRVLAALPDPVRYHFLLKPHPSASATSLAATIERCKERGLSFTLMDDPLHKGMAAEVLFAEHMERTEHVFCLFSSACFYLSQLYRDRRIIYHYSTDFMDKWTGNAPPMYKRHFGALKPLISEVFAERCVPY